MLYQNKKFLSSFLWLLSIGLQTPGDVEHVKLLQHDRQPGSMTHRVSQPWSFMSVGSIEKTWYMPMEATIQRNHKFF